MDHIEEYDRIIFAEMISGDIYGLLYQDSTNQNLKLAVFQNALQGRVLSLVSVAPSVTPNRAQFFMDQKTMAVIYQDSVGVMMSRAPVLIE